MTNQQLLKLKELQDKASKKIDNLKGQEESVLQQLKNQYSCKDDKEVKEKIKEYDDQKKQLQEQYDSGTEELEQWLEEQQIDLEEL